MINKCARTSSCELLLMKKVPKLFVKFVQPSVKNKAMESIQNCERNIAKDVRMGAEQASSSLLAAKWR
jgi:hypothetical protein